MFQIIKPGTKIPFLAATKYYLAFSVALLVICAAIISVKGFQYGIDFAGGTVIQAKFNNKVELDQVRTAISQAGAGDAIIQNFGDDGNDILIRIEQSEKELDDISREIQSSLHQSFQDNKVEIVRIEQVGPQVGDQLKAKAIYAIIYALIGMLIYIAFRFRFIYAIGAVASLALNVVFLLGVFSALGKEIDLTIVAALLTVVGYQINDTIVVFDRLRENLGSQNYEGMSLREVLDASLNETLSRTVLTGGTTLFAVISLYIFGGEVINGFSFMLLLGLIFGTFASVCVAAAIVYAILDMKEKKAATA
jgi:preprotein translocase subunit SecF